MFFYFYETFKIAFFSAIFQSSRTLTEAYSANTVGYQPGLSVDKLEEWLGFNGTFSTIRLCRALEVIV